MDNNNINNNLKSVASFFLLRCRVLSLFLNTLFSTYLFITLFFFVGGESSSFASYKLKIELLFFSLRLT